MTDPKRWLDERDGGDEDALRLVRLGKTLGPRQGSADRAWTEFLAISAGSPSDSSGDDGTGGGGLEDGGGTGLPDLGGGGWGGGLAGMPLVKSLLLGAALGVGGVVTARVIERAGERPVASRPARERSVGAPVVPSAVAVESPRPPTDSPSTIADSTPDKAPESVAPTARPPAAPAATAAPPPAATGVVSFPTEVGITSYPLDAAKTASLLQQEAREVAEAKALLAQRRTSAALALLRASSARFRSGTLGQEREVLTIEALAQSGDVASARDRARAFVSQFPRSPLVPRVERFTSR